MFVGAPIVMCFSLVLLYVLSDKPDSLVVVMLIYSWGIISSKITVSPIFGSSNL